METYNIEVSYMAAAGQTSHTRSVEVTASNTIDAIKSALGSILPGQVMTCSIILTRKVKDKK